ncbi:MAG: winged helix DNA-binding protein [Anaerolineae bacterium]|nr:winged helix DNA-binding protein [Anaerolineae bacterium]
MSRPEPNAPFHSARALAEALTGQADVDASGMEMARLVKMTAHLYDSVVVQGEGATEVSGPRLFLLGRLFIAEKQGNTEGLSPTHLSHWRKVSKNTISALLRGLEEQGLIQRTLDPVDKRVFRIRLTDAGREFVRSTAPQHVAYMNSLLADLTPPERAQLLELLGKLSRSLAARCGLPEHRHP